MKFLFEIIGEYHRENNPPIDTKDLEIILKHMLTEMLVIAPDKIIINHIDSGQIAELE